VRYEILATGSDANCTVIERQIAVDMGVPWYKVAPYAKDLALVLLTHTHGDHFNKATVRRMAKNRPSLRWACGPWMVGPLLSNGVDRRCIDVLRMDEWQSYGRLGILVCAIETRHDVPNCAWCIWRDERDSIFYATDTGTLDGIEAKGYGTYLVEANYRDAELQQRIAEKMDAGGFAYETRAAETHLSWEQATEWLQENMAEWSLWVPMHEHKDKGGYQDGLVRSAPDAG